MSRANRNWFHKKSRFPKKLGIFLVILVAVLLCVGIVGVRHFDKTKNILIINIQVDNYEMFQDETLPEIKVEAVCDDADEEIQKFIADIHAGIGYSIFTEGDLSKEGNYTLDLEWEESVKEKLSGEWKDKVKCNVKKGNLVVKNKYGVWDGDKFKKHDETYAADEFIVWEGKDYYFDEMGNKVAGEYVINGYTYYFTDDGVFDAEKNKIHPGKPLIALTFDDGPGLYTEALIDVLVENGARATFFVLGEQVKKFPDVIRKMDEAGCQIGNHTYSHRRLTELSKEDMEFQIKETNKIIEEILGKETKLVRPTYGAVNESVRKNVDYPLVMWSLDTEDWDLKDAKAIEEVILSQVKEGDIVLMHDIHDFTFEAMKNVIPKLIEEGYQLVTVAELAAINGVVMKNGVKYFEF